LQYGIDIMSNNKKKRKYVNTISGIETETETETEEFKRKFSEKFVAMSTDETAQRE